MPPVQRMLLLFHMHLCDINHLDLVCVCFVTEAAAL